MLPAASQDKMRRPGGRQSPRHLNVWWTRVRQTSAARFSTDEENLFSSSSFHHWKARLLVSRLLALFSVPPTRPSTSALRWPASPACLGLMVCRAFRPAQLAQAIPRESDEALSFRPSSFLSIE